MADISDKTQNVSIVNNTETKTVDTITDGSIERLAVDAFITNPGGVALERFSPQFNYSTANTVLSDVSYTTLFELTSTKGRIGFISLAATRSDYKFKLSVDGTQRLEISMGDLGSTIGLSSTIGTSIPLFTAIANKNLIYNPLVPVDFDTGFKVEAIKTVVQSVTINWLISYRTLI